jgi:hypothetical protein
VKVRLACCFGEIKYNDAIIVQEKRLTENRVLSVNVSIANDLIATIDFTALLHFHHHAIDDSKIVLDQFFGTQEISLASISLDMPFFNMIKSPLPFWEGEELFVIESVLFSIIEKLSPVSLSRINCRSIKCNQLYSKMDSKTPSCLKIKIRPTEESLEETKNIVGPMMKTNPEVSFRLDGNRSFDLLQLLNFMKSLENFCGPDFFNSVEYLEEPLKNHAEYPEFSKLRPYPEALDETIIDALKNKNDLNEIPKTAHLILKPSLIGISKCFELMSRSAETGHKIIISSCYETYSAIRPLLFLAASSPLAYHGLDTLKFLPKPLVNNNTDFTLLF